MNELTIATNNSQARILVVDDHPGTAEMLARAISQLGLEIEVLSATSGKMALDEVKNGAVDVLITDMVMPEMSGLELIEKLRNHPAGRPAHTILMTAYEVPGLKETARRLNVNDIIIKPFRPERICQIVGKAIGDMGHTNPPKRSAETRQPFNILIADDMPDNVALLSRYLTNEGCAFITASDGVEALEKIRSDMPDLILLDINMPKKDGFVVLREIRADQALQHIPVIILTAAKLDPVDMQTGFGLGANDYVTKPFDRRELMARIHSKLRIKEAEDAIRRRNKELNLLPELGKELSARLDINELTDIVLRRTVETLGAMLGHLIILNSREPLHKEYHIASSENPSVGAQLPPLNDLVNQVKSAHQGLIIEDADNDQRWQKISGDSTHSAVIVPMFGRHDLLGLIILTHERVNYFNVEHQFLLQAIAGQAAIAVENAQLYASMARQQQRLSAVLQSVADPILMFDADGCLSLINPAAEKLFTDYDAKIGLPLARGCGYETFINSLETALGSGTSETSELLWPDQRVFAALLTPIDSGGCVALLHDVSHFKALERVKNEFISTASHDLKNPIATITGFSQIISQAGPLNETQQDFANRIHSAAKNMNELVQNLLELAKMDSGVELKHETIDLNDLIVEIADEFEPQAHTKQQSLTFKKTTSQATVQGDAFQLRQALRNLVGNAIKYTPTNGTINLSVDLEQYTVVVRVNDTGYGIPTADLPFIFDRFYRVREGRNADMEGNGLGLAIVKSIVEGHGGDVTVESEVGQGSCFTITLPIMTQKPSQDVKTDFLEAGTRICL